MWTTGLMVLLLTSETAAQLSGRCFDADLGGWSPIAGTHLVDGPPVGPPSESADSMFYAFPPRVLFTDEAPSRMDRSGAYRLDIPEQALQVPKPFRWWTLQGDSLSVGLSDGFTSVTASLRRSNDGWEGLLRTRSDNMGTQRYERLIVLRGVDCDSEPPVLASSDAAAPRSVPSSTGPPLELARPVPSDYMTEPVRSFLLVQGLEAAGPWAGSDSVLVRVNRDGLISRIELRYPQGFDAGPLEAELLAEYGPGRPDSSWPVWWNRTTRSSLQVGSRVRLRMIDPRMRY